MSRLVTNHHTRPIALRIRRPSSGLRMLPSFVVAGAQKACTTSLFEMIGRHPDVTPAVLKETRHFDLTPDRPVDEYRSYFPIRAATSQRITGEATPDYLLFPWVPDALAAAVPRVRVIVILRDPVDRAFSHYCHAVARGEEHLDFEAALEAEPGRLADGPVAPGTAAAMRYSRFSYAARGRYAEQLRRWFAAFPRERLLVLQFRDLAERPQDVFDQTTAFLGLRAITVSGPTTYNVGSSEAIPSRSRRRLSDYFAPHDTELADLLGEAPYWVDQTA